MGWDTSDSGISLFLAARRKGAPVTFQPGMRVLEVGCCEETWLKSARAEWPDVTFVGVDQRDTPEVKANVLDANIFRVGEFDAIVGLSVFEHMGLGHYGDPTDAYGDTIALTHCWIWLKQNGWIYFDVPFNPSGYRVHGTEYRVYDEAHLQNRLNPKMHGGHRLYRQSWEGFAHMKTPALLSTDRPGLDAEPFYDTARVWQKV